MKSRQLLRKANELTKIETPQALWHLLKTNAFTAGVLMQHPPYNVFTVPKKNGKQRIIEDPADALQTLQARLNDYLQPLYFFNRTEAAYGYLIKPDDVRETRNIVTNAKVHSRSRYLLNIDVKDFFHYIKWQKLFDALTAAPFNIHYDVAVCICHLCTFNGRLPMGAPTSPALSNIAAHKFDREMQQYCLGEKMTFTRYVDDMSFSGDAEITERHFSQLCTIITKEGYEPHPQKIKWFGDGDTKIITGLHVKNGTVSVAPDYMHEIEAEIKNLRGFVLMHARMHPRQHKDFSHCKPAQKIKGAMAFVASVHGYAHPPLEALERQLDNALNPPQDYESMHWLEIGYQVF